MLKYNKEDTIKRGTSCKLKKSQLPKKKDSKKRVCDAKKPQGTVSIPPRLHLLTPRMWPLPQRKQLVPRLHYLTQVQPLTPQVQPLLTVSPAWRHFAEACSRQCGALSPPPHFQQ